MKSVSELIETKRATTRGVSMTPAALQDMKAVLAANDKEPNKFRRVTVADFVKYLRTKHRITMSGETLRRQVQVRFGRVWGVK